MRNELKKAIEEYVDESVYGEFEHDIFDLITYLNAANVEFDSESEYNEIEAYYYEYAEK